MVKTLLDRTTMTVMYTCRLCLFTSPVASFPILNTKAADMLEALTDIKVEPTDEVLTMCLKCSLNLKLAYSIQRNFLLCDEQIRKGFVKEPSALKQSKNEEFVISEEIIKEEAPELTSCIVCDETMDEISLVSHTKQHFAEEQFCNLCDQNFNDIKTYRTHLTQHPEHTPLKCEKCDATFLYKSLYDIHMKKTHSDKAQATAAVEKKYKRFHGPPFACDECDRQFETKDKLLHHRYGHRRKDCPICNKSITSYNFYRHVQNHNSSTQICEQCGKTYSNMENLRGHIFYAHRGKKYECKECNLTFKSRQTLNHHNKRKHGKGNGHVCETCGRKFIQAYVLKKHILTSHMNLRPYPCDYCKKTFSRLHTLKTHQRQHTNETPYKCEDCGEGFRQNVSLRMHRKSKHNIVEVVTCNCETCGKGFSSEHALKAHMRCH